MVFGSFQNIVVKSVCSCVFESVYASVHFEQTHSTAMATYLNHLAESERERDKPAYRDIVCGSLAHSLFSMGMCRYEHVCVCEYSTHTGENHEQIPFNYT